ncbi:MAG TPA: hypothetical protein VFM54_14295 [Micromonosporaceae bacterium]|nr:hypothetical protein [Micromonosporaceae bacterium]
MTSHGEPAGVTALLSRRLVQRRQEASRRPWRERWTARHVPSGLRGTLGRRTDRYARNRADRTNRGHFD